MADSEREREIETLAGVAPRTFVKLAGCPWTDESESVWHVNKATTARDGERGKTDSGRRSVVLQRAGGAEEWLVFRFTGSDETGWRVTNCGRWDFDGEQSSVDVGPLSVAAVNVERP